MAEQGVTHALCVSVSRQGFPTVRQLARDHANLYATAGVHPDQPPGDEVTADELHGWASDPRVVAIGETGLDYFRQTDDPHWQRERFRTHIRVARSLGKPLVVHTRDAEIDTLSIMREEGVARIGGVMHCFTGDFGFAQAAMDLGFYISISGIVTFKNAAVVKDVAARVPLERLLLETDSPYLAPVPHRGRSNEPAYVRHVAAEVARLRNSTPELVASATTANFFRLFSCPGAPQ